MQMNNFGKKVNPDDKDMDREMARERGIATYVSKIPCKHGHTGLRYTKSGECRACVHTRNYKARGVYASDADTVEKRRAIEDRQSRKRDEYDF